MMGLQTQLPLLNQFHFRKDNETFNLSAVKHYKLIPSTIMPRENTEMYMRLNFQLIKHNNKYSALCLICKRSLSNTALSRVKAHRNRCISKPKSRTKIKLSSESDRSDSLAFALEQETGIEDDDSAESYLPLTLSLSPNQSSSFTSTAPPTTSSIQVQPQINVEKINVNSSARETKPIFLGQNKKTSAKSLPKLTVNDHIEENEIEEFNFELAKFFLGCNIPFAVVESEHFKNFISKLRPAYAEELPSRKTLSSIILGKLCDRSVD